MRRSATAPLLGVAGVAVVAAAMLPFRSHLSLATPGLVLVVPVVAGPRCASDGVQSEV